MKKRIIFLCVLILIALATWAPTFFRTMREDSQLFIAFLDIGQGDAIYVRAPSGVDMLIDGGPDGITVRRLAEVLPFYDREITMLMITNPDKDHIGGFVDILKTYTIDILAEPGTQTSSATYREVKRMAAEKQVKNLFPTRGDVFDLGKGVTFTVLFPDRDVSLLSTNDGSLVGLLRYGDIRILFMGDSPSKIEEYLAQLDEQGNAEGSGATSYLQAHVLKVGHHGSDTSTSEVLLNKVKPSFAIISAGKGNSYHHPKLSVVERLDAHGISVLSTIEKGTIFLKSDGKSIEWSSMK